VTYDWQKPPAKDCGHDHREDWLQQRTCNAMHALADFAGKTPNVVIALRDVTDERPPALSFFGNIAGAGAMVAALLEFAGKQPRPTDCVTCIDAYDRMRQCLAIMDALPPRC
jgi:hypothetical protein